MGNGNAANSSELDKMRAKILQIGQKYEKVKVRRTKSGPMEPFALKMLLLSRELFGGLQDIILEFFGWLNTYHYCYKNSIMEFFTTIYGLKLIEAEFIIEFLTETGFIVQYIFPDKVIIGMDLGADAVIRNMGVKSYFSINTVREIEKLAGLAVVVPPRS